MQLILVLLGLPFVTGCRSVKFFKGEGLALENHVIKTVTDIQPISCGWQCVDTPLCFSMNVRKLPTGGVTCDLNNSSQKAHPQDLISSPGSQYHQIAEIEHCTAEQCIYKDALPDGWYRFGSKILKVVFERKTWEQARQFCQSIGGKLVSINQDNENEFITHLLDQIKTSMTGKNNMISHWVLDGSDADVSLFNGARYEEVDGEKALSLKEPFAYATTPPVDFSNTSFTMASHVKLLLADSAFPSPLYGYWTDPHHFLFDANVRGQLRFKVKHDTGSYTTVSGGNPTTNKWFHMAAVWDRDANKAYLYQDGQIVASEPMTSHAIRQSYSFYDIGLKRGSNQSLKGYLRDLMIIGKALTSDEIINIKDLNYEPFDGVWIGLNDITTEGAFHWPDGSHVTYSKWNTDQPDNKHNYQDCAQMNIVKGSWDYQDCVQMNIVKGSWDYQDCAQMNIVKGSWDDVSCAGRLPFLCEKKA